MPENIDAQKTPNVAGTVCALVAAVLFGALVPFSKTLLTSFTPLQLGAFMLLGAGSVQVTTAVMQYGYRSIEDLKAGLNLYLAEKGFRSVDALVGLALDSVSNNTDALERDTVVFPKFRRNMCVGCGRCAISCADGGHQAIRLSAGRKPVLDGKKCVGCHLCVLVCPQRAIVPSGKRFKREFNGNGGME